MDDLQRDPRPCAHCGGVISADDMTCASCGRAYIPDPPVETAPTAGEAGATDRLDRPPGRATGADQHPRPDDTTATDGPPPLGDTSGPQWRSPAAEPAYAAPATVPADSRNWAMAAPASALAGALLGGLPAFLGPLLIWLLRKDQQDPFATEHARQALNFNLSVIIYAVAAVVLVVLTVGVALLLVVPLGLLAFVGYLVVTIRAIIAASRGQAYRYPFTISLVN